jgi:hypothetical protein
MKRLFRTLYYGYKYAREMEFLESQEALIKAKRYDEAISIGQAYINKYGAF